MTNTKNNLPLYAEEQIIQQKIKIPTNFVELETKVKNYMCSTQGWKGSVCERYGFSANGKWVQLDITHQLMTKLELELGKEIAYPLYISPSVLKQKPDEFGGITINNEKDIICQKAGIILVQEKTTQVDLTTSEITDLKQKLKKSEELSQETQTLLEKVLKDNEEKHIAIIFFEEEIKNLTQRITELRRDLEQEILDKKREESKSRELERVIRNLRENEQVLIGLQNENSELKRRLANQFTTLTTERNNIQQNLTNLETRLCHIQGRFLGSLFRSNKRSKEIKELKIQRARLRTELVEKDQQITNLNNTIAARNQTIAGLNTQINQLTTQRDNLDGTLRSKDQTIADLRTNLTNESNAKTRTQGEVNRLNGEVNNLKNQLQSVQDNYNYYYNEYRTVNNRLQELGDLSEVQEVDIFDGATFEVRKLEIDEFEAKLSNKLSSNGSIANIEMSGIKSIGKLYYNNGLVREGYIFGSLHYKKRKVRIVSPNNYSSDDDSFRVIQWDETDKTIADCTSHNWITRKV